MSAHSEVDKAVKALFPTKIGADAVLMNTADVGTVNVKVFPGEKRFVTAEDIAAQINSAEEQVAKMDSLSTFFEPELTGESIDV